MSQETSHAGGFQAGSRREPEPRGEPRGAGRWSGRRCTVTSEGWPGASPGGSRSSHYLTFISKTLNQVFPQTKRGSLRGRTLIPAGSTVKFHSLPDTLCHRSHRPKS